jgi:hypothetical protein
MPYKLPEDGYYYFRPYHYSQVAIQQNFVSEWGGDRRNPYSFEVFDQIETEELPGVEPDEQPQSSRQPMLPESNGATSAIISQTSRLSNPIESTVAKPGAVPHVDINQLGIAWCGDQD